MTASNSLLGLLAADYRLMEPSIKQLEAQLQETTERFEQQMRARGFDPEQAENVALPTTLAKLYVERQLLLEKLEEIQRESK